MLIISSCKPLYANITRYLVNVNCYNAANVTQS